MAKTTREGMKTLHRIAKDKSPPNDALRALMARPHPDIPALLAEAQAVFDGDNIVKMRIALSKVAHRLKATHEARVRVETIFTSAGGIDPTELDDAADIVETENGYLARQLRGAASAARAALSVPQGEK